MSQLDQRPAIEVDHLPLPFGVQFGEPTGQSKAGIVDQQIDAFSMRLKIGHQPVARARLAQIEGDPAGIAKLLGELFQPLAAPGNKQQAITLPGKLAGEIDAETGGGTGYEG